MFRIKPYIPIANDPLLELDRSGRKFELCLEQGEPVLNVIDLKQFLPCTCNLDPYLNKLIRGLLFVSFFSKIKEKLLKLGSPAYFYMTNSDEKGFRNSDLARFYSPGDPTWVARHSFICFAFFSTYSLFRNFYHYYCHEW